MESWVVNNISLANWNTCWAIGRRWVDDGKVSRDKATWRVAEDLTSKQSVLIRWWIDSMEFHSQNPHHPPGLWHSDHRSIVLVTFIPMTYVFLLFLSSYLLIFVIQPIFIPIFIQTPICLTHFHSFAYSYLSYLCIGYLIYVAIAIRLDHLCD